MDYIFLANPELKDAKSGTCIEDVENMIVGSVLILCLQHYTGDDSLLQGLNLNTCISENKDRDALDTKGTGAKPAC